MRGRPTVAGLVLMGLLVGGLCGIGATEDLPRLLRIDWREGPEYPMGIQEAVMGPVGGMIVCAGGFTRSAREIVKLYPDAFHGQANGFTDLTLAYDPAHESAGWTRLPDIPGAPRQAAAGVVVNNQLYSIGGFSYDDPYCYRESYRLERRGQGWVWRKLPCDLPFPMCEACAVAIGPNIYVFAGTDYYKAPGAKDQGFHCDVGRTGEPVGRALLKLDTRNIHRGWQRLPDLPGTPRFDCAGAAAGGKIYALCGVFAPLTTKPGEPEYSNVVDAWVFDPQCGTWSRLPDMPDGGNRRALTFRDRYLLLVAAYRFPFTHLLDGTVRLARTDEEKQRDWKTFFEKTVLVYDTKTSRLGTADPLLDPTSWPTATIDGDTVYSVGGEGGSRLWHPATFQIGRIRPPQ